MIRFCVFLERAFLRRPALRCTQVTPCLPLIFLNSSFRRPVWPPTSHHRPANSLCANRFATMSTTSASSTGTKPPARPLQSSLVVVVATGHLGYLSALCLAAQGVNLTLLDLALPSVTSSTPPSPASSSSSIAGAAYPSPVVVRPRHRRFIPSSVLAAATAASSTLHLVITGADDAGKVQKQHVEVPAGAPDGFVFDHASLDAGLRAAVRASNHIVTVAIEAVTSLAFAPDGWAKLTIRTRDGAARSMRSKLLVAADGGSVLQQCASAGPDAPIELLGRLPPPSVNNDDGEHEALERFIKVDDKALRRTCDAVSTAPSHSLAFAAHDADAALVVGPVTRARGARFCRLRAPAGSGLWRARTDADLSSALSPLCLDPKLLPTNAMHDFLGGLKQFPPTPSTPSAASSSSQCLAATIGGSGDTQKQGAILFVHCLNDAVAITPSPARSPADTARTFVDDRLPDALAERRMAAAVRATATADFAECSLLRHQGLRAAVGRFVAANPACKAAGAQGASDARVEHQEDVANGLVVAVKALGVALPLAVVSTIARAAGRKRDDDD